MLNSKVWLTIAIKLLLLSTTAQEVINYYPREALTTTTTTFCCPFDRFSRLLFLFLFLPVLATTFDRIPAIPPVHPLNWGCRLALLWCFITITLSSLCSIPESMEIIPEGRNFRLLHDDELNDVLEVLEKYIPEALKVSSDFLGHSRRFRFFVPPSE